MLYCTGSKQGACWKDRVVRHLHEPNRSPMLKLHGSRWLNLTRLPMLAEDALQWVLLDRTSGVF